MRRCWLSYTLDLTDHCSYRADGRPDQAHVGLSEHYLTKAPTGPHLSKDEANDPRLLRPICRKHHDRLDKRILRLSRDQIPESVEDYARQYGLVHILNRRYPSKTKEKNARCVEPHTSTSRSSDEEAAEHAAADLLRPDLKATHHLSGQERG